ncbi:MAG: LacI family transcriptional regulator, partial [Caldilineae bacterium]
MAARAGVSLATVSRVLNHTAPVSERTRLRVEEAVHALGYQHQNVGRRQPIQAIALLIPDILNPYFAEIVRGAEDETEHEGLSLVLFNTTEDPEREEQALDRLLHMALEGAVLFGSRVPSKRLVAFQQEGQLPVVVINRRVESPNVACVLVDSEQATYRATRYLINMGHSRIAHLAGPSGSASAAARQQGIRRALADAGLSLPDAWCVPSFPDIEGGFQAMSSLLTTGAEVP